jgi:hypothetical protein
MESVQYLPCPHCNNVIEIHLNEINCKIYRHAVYKDTYEQIDPHMSKEKIAELIATESILGCGKPFQIVVMKDGCKLVECEYI